jgi:hypothetical protein
MQESWVLDPEEQDRLVRAFINLQVAALLYDTKDFTSDIASAMLTVIREAVSTMEKHGLFHSPAHLPSWDEETKETTT